MALTVCGEFLVIFSAAQGVSGSGGMYVMVGWKVRVEPLPSEPIDAQLEQHTSDALTENFQSNSREKSGVEWRWKLRGEKVLASIQGCDVVDIYCHHSVWLINKLIPSWVGTYDLFLKCKIIPCIFTSQCAISRLRVGVRATTISHWSPASITRLKGRPYKLAAGHTTATTSVQHSEVIAECWVYFPFYPVDIIFYITTYSTYTIDSQKVSFYDSNSLIFSFFPGAPHYFHLSPLYF